MKKMVGAALVFVSAYSLMSFAKDIDKNGNTKAATSREEFCKNAEDPNYFKSLIYNNNNVLARVNEGGIGGMGVCWWHSMFSRSATYLAVYRPELPRPSKEQVRNIIEDIAGNKGIVEIPGYNNLAEFSFDYADQIQHVLNGMQIADGGIMFGWVRGLSGSSEVPAAQLKTMMDDLYQEVKFKNRIVYQKLQIPGVSAHAWLVVDITKTLNGYELEVLDSNMRDTYVVHYTVGMTQILEYGGIVPYTSRNGLDYSSFSSAKNQYCQRGFTAEYLREMLSHRGGNR